MTESGYREKIVKGVLRLLWAVFLITLFAWTFNHDHQWGWFTIGVISLLYLVDIRDDHRAIRVQLDRLISVESPKDPE